MIFYPLVCNDGGMLRVAESFVELLRANPELPVTCVILADKRPAFCTNLEIPWIQWNDQLKMTDPRINEIRAELKEIYFKSKYSWIISDLMTNYFLLDFEGAKFCYDVHFLCRPFYATLGSQKDLMPTTRLFGLSYSMIHELAELNTVRNETLFFKMASAFISNSANSTHFLKTMYKDCVKSKPIFEVPVSSSLPLSQKVQEKDFILFNGRVHVQKGLHFLVHHKWEPFPLVIRGLHPAAILPKETYDYLAGNNISLLPFSSNNQETAEIISSAKAVLFPSIYEPWGLSLQEALSLGKICIAHFSASGHEEQIIDGVNGFLRDFSRPDIVSEVNKILSLPEEILLRVKEKAMQSSVLGYVQRNQTLISTLLNLLESESSNS